MAKGCDQSITAWNAIDSILDALWFNLLEDETKLDWEYIFAWSKWSYFQAASDSLINKSINYCSLLISILISNVVFF